MSTNRLVQASAKEGNREPSLARTTTKQPNRYTFYCSAIFNYEGKEELLKNRLQQICKKFMWGYEICPNTGNKHLQAFIHLLKPMRCTEFVIPELPIKWQNCKGDEIQNTSYCSKDGNVYKWGYPKPLKLITPDKDWQVDILNLIATEPDDRKVYWFWSENGGVGKSQFAKYCVATQNCLFFEEGKKADIMHLIFEAPEERLGCMIIDVPRANGNNVSYKAIESIKNGMIYSPKYEGGYKLFNSPHIIVFANEPPETSKLSEDRWVIRQID